MALGPRVLTIYKSYNTSIGLILIVIKGTYLRIVHLVTSLVGGAANAALRLNSALVQGGHESTVITVERRVKRAEINEVQAQMIGKRAQIFSSVVTFLQRSLIQKSSDQVSPVNIDLLNWDDSRIQASDVIHLHAFYNLATIKNFLSLYPNKVKVVTLHDERFYTGGCHYSYGCKQILSGCHGCPQVHGLARPLVSKARRDVLQSVKSYGNVIFICPSDWILENARQAFPEISPDRFIKIFNPIPALGKETKKRLSNRDRLILGFISQELDNPLKNLALLLSAYDKLNASHPNKYGLKLIGNSTNDYASNQDFIEQTSVNSKDELQAALAEIDILIVPSTHDNSPNVLGEALMNGVGIIGSDVGGIPEILNVFSLESFESGNEQSLISAILNFKLPNSEKLQNLANSVFGYDSISNVISNVYRQEITRIERTSNLT